MTRLPAVSAVALATELGTAEPLGGEVPDGELMLLGTQLVTAASTMHAAASEARGTAATRSVVIGPIPWHGETVGRPAGRPPSVYSSKVADSMMARISSTCSAGVPS